MKRLAILAIAMVTLASCEYRLQPPEPEYDFTLLVKNYDNTKDTIKCRGRYVILGNQSLTAVGENGYVEIGFGIKNFSILERNEVQTKQKINNNEKQ
ncbi:hypothetical protein MA9V2_032 [Chryseobacterium phage MA9V-2]|nr:hypothetical protein MA9V2_032 [Chryseobacterium phage MA9V-2]